MLSVMCGGAEGCDPSFVRAPRPPPSDTEQTQVERSQARTGRASSKCLQPRCFLSSHSLVPPFLPLWQATRVWRLFLFGCNEGREADAERGRGRGEGGGATMAEGRVVPSHAPASFLPFLSFPRRAAVSRPVRRRRHRLSPASLLSQTRFRREFEQTRRGRRTRYDRDTFPRSPVLLLFVASTATPCS
jgi:hypothetical protein